MEAPPAAVHRSQPWEPMTVRLGNERGRSPTSDGRCSTVGVLSVRREGRGLGSYTEVPLVCPPARIA